MAVKNIYITYEKGLEKLAPIIEEGIREMMDCFPRSKGYGQAFPIIDLENWKSDQYEYLSEGQRYLKPYESIEWYVERAKQRAELDGRFQSKGQISCNQLCEDLLNDPYASKIPQFSLLITKHDLYATLQDGKKLNFCNGYTQEGRFSVISTARFVRPNGVLESELFKGVVMHEFGHLIGLTPTGRKNSYEELGTHCSNGDVMEQDVRGRGEKMRDNLRRRKMLGLKPICDDCINAGIQFLDREIARFQARVMQTGRGYN